MARVLKQHKAILTPKSDTQAVKVEVDESARLREIRALVQANNQSTIEDDMIICQIYMESQFDKNAGKGTKHDAKGLMQVQTNAIKQVYKYRKQKEFGRMTSDTETAKAFSDAAKDHANPDIIFDEAQNIQIGTEYMQYFVDQTSTLEDAYIGYRHGLQTVKSPEPWQRKYYQKISAAAEELKKSPDSMQPLRAMFGK